jgi:hypothetical protein
MLERLARPRHTPISVFRMSRTHRLKRLTELLDQLERLPPSAERDRMLREVRARFVDVDTGEAPSALPPLFAEKPTHVADPPRRIRRAPNLVAPTRADEVGRRRATPVREPAQPVQSADRGPGGASPGAGDPLTAATDELLFLDDSAWLSPSDSRPEPVPAWRRGLRG